MRIGHGYDVHRFGEGDFVVLGGEKIAHSHGLLAHSDGDVVLHALCDSLLGAAGLGDIGQHFPDTDEQYANADSRVLLRHCIDLLRARAWQVANTDITIVAQAPRIAGHSAAMRANIAADIGVALDCVNIKATTTETLGFEGRKEGIACHAISLLIAG